MRTTLQVELLDRPAGQTELEVTLLMPCLNEAETIADCVVEARAALMRAGAVGEVLVADNGSTDGSQLLAAAHGARVIQIAGRGYGRALAGGIGAARGRYVLMGDADGSYDFGELPRFLEQLDGGADLVMGCRLPVGGGRIQPGAMPWKHRWIGNPVLSALGRLFFAVPVHDLHCGLRAFRRKAIGDLGLRCPGMEYASEMVVRASMAGLRLAEVPVTLRPDGRTRPPHLRSWRDGWRHLRFMLLFSPRWLFMVPGLALASASLVLFLLLLGGPLRLGPVTFDINSLILAGAGLVTGIQTVLIGVMAEAAATGLGLVPPTPLLTRLQGRRPVELGLLAGAVLLLLGIGYVLWAVESWRKAGFGDLSPDESVRIVVPAVTAIAIGIQLAFSGFVLATIEFGRELRLQRGQP
ncbi:MAG: glycosyltransferase family 2 protein [Geminicoccaceae bacterium]